MLPHSRVWPQRLVNITCNIFPCQTSREEAPWVPYPSLNCTHINLITCLFHGLHKRHAHKGLPVVYLPPPCEKNSSMGFRNGEYGGRYCTRNVGWSANQFWTGAARWKLTLSHTTTYRFLWWSASFMLWSLSRNVRIWAVLYGPRLTWRWRTPCILEMAAHIVMFPPRWPGTSIMALWPMTFLPLLLVFARLNPASSIKMNSCGIAWASISSTPSTYARLNSLFLWEFLSNGTL